MTVDEAMEVALEEARRAAAAGEVPVGAVMLHDGELIEIRLVEGPFRYLEGRWHFAPLDADGCRVTLDLDFEFASRLMGRTLTPIFSEIADSMVDAFCRRAAELYGRS